MNTEILKLFNQIEIDAESYIEAISDITMNSPVYAAAFWLFYCDKNVIHPPALAINSLEGLTSDSDELGSNKWSPPDWKYPDDGSFTEALMPLYLEISKLLKGADDDAWEEVIRLNDHLYCRLSKLVTTRAHSKTGKFSGWNITEDFVTLAMEESAGPEFYNWLIKASVEADRLEKLESVLFENICN